MSIRLARLSLIVILAAMPLAGLAASLDHNLRGAAAPGLRNNPDGHLVGAVVSTGKADTDSVYLVGGPDRADGSFENVFGQPDWHGWTHADAYIIECMWQVSDFQAIDGALSAWCGTYYGDDPGYGNQWDQRLVFRHHVADPSAATTVTWTALLQNDTEAGYDDITHFAANRDGVWEDLHAVDGNVFEDLDLEVTYGPADYVGPANDEIQLRIQVTTGSGWSDQDGRIDTNGACQVDNIAVSANGALISFEDCEDGVLDDWECETPVVGDFTALWQDLDDLDRCRDNHSVQVAFIDDGVVVPGTGGTVCTTWCYGPGGYIVNNTGGLTGSPAFLFNRLISPVLDLPTGMVGLEAALDVYVHEELGNVNVWPGIFYAFEVRSTADPVNQPLADRPWYYPGDVWYGRPLYKRQIQALTYLMEPGAVQAQVAYSVIDENQWYNGIDGTPAPYFDNVAIKAYDTGGPHIESMDWWQAQDAFPELGDLDLANLAANSVRFDAATGEDYLTYRAKAVRAGSTLLGPPAMHVRMRPNPLFDGVRQLPGGFTFADGLIAGEVPGDPVYNDDDPPAPTGKYHFDLPDTGFFFPGDAIHYYVEARDEVAGDIGIARLPADTTGLTDFSSLSPYSPYLRVCALPSLRSAVPGDQPPIILYVDAGTFAPHWHHALLGLGFDYDVYRMKAFPAGRPNSLGHQATSALLDGYTTLLLTSGSSGGAPDGADAQLLDNWFNRGEKRALMSGDDLVRSLATGNSWQQALLNTYLGVQYVQDDVSAFIENQVSPRVGAQPGNGFIAQVEQWTALGGCPSRAAMDAIEAVGATVRLAEFLDPAGYGGAYSLAAATYHVDETSGAGVVLFPYDLGRVIAAPGWTSPPGRAGLTPRALILEDILAGFGLLPPNDPVAAPDALPFTVQVAPNPFNPRTGIDFTVPRAGVVRIELYDLRGSRVRILLDEPRSAGAHTVVWDGTTDQGGPAASGVYFCQVRAVGERRVRKLTLIR